MSVEAHDYGELLANAPAMQKQLTAEVFRRSLRDAIPYMWPVLEPSRPYIPGWPVDAVCEHLEAVTKGEITRLIMNVPPGSMKSLSTRVFWPAWEWTQKPNAARGILGPTTRFIGASYAEHLALRDNRRARSVITSQFYQQHFPEVQLSDEQKSKINFANRHTGWMFATSTQGIGVGERGDRFVIDDPHNIQNVESPAVRETTLRWFAEIVPSRLNDLDKSAIIVIMQRTHADDVTGYALEHELGYEHLMIPMHFDPARKCYTSIGWEDPRSEDGALMWPERFSPQAVEQLEKNLGPYASAAQLEQSPVPRSGGQFEVDKIVLKQEIPEGDYFWARGWDLAGSEGKGAYTAGVKIGLNKKTKRVIIADVKRERLGGNGVRLLLENTAETDTKAVPIILPQDPGQAGKVQAEDLVALLHGYIVKIEAQTGSKETRAEPFAAQIEAGNVDCLDRPWTKDLLDEMRLFPKGKYKDQSDAGASAYNHVAANFRKKPVSWSPMVTERPNPFGVN